MQSFASPHDIGASCASPSAVVLIVVAPHEERGHIAHRSGRTAIGDNDKGQKEARHPSQIV